MKSYLPLLALAALTMLAGCAAGPTASMEPRPFSLATGANQVSSEGAAAPHRNEPGAFEIADDATLDDLLRYAAEHSPAMRTAFEEWRAAVEREPQARALPDPQLSYGYFVERMETRQTVSLSQMFPAFGRRGLRGEMAERAAEAAEQRFEAARLAVFSRVKTAYSEWAYIEEAIEVLREVRVLVKEFEEVALARFRSGEVGSADALRVEMEGERIADDLRTMEEMLQPAKAALNASLGRPGGAPLPAPRLEEFPALDQAAEKDLEVWLAANPDLRAREREIARAEAGIELARRESWPDVMVGVEYMDNIGMAPDETMVMVGINLPIWRENYAAARREARAERNASVARRENLERELEADLRMALFRVRDAERKIRLYHRSLQPLARQTYDSLIGAYRAGDTDFIDLIDAQRTVLDVELSGRRAVADHIQRVAELERLTGGGIHGDNGRTRPLEGAPR